MEMKQNVSESETVLFIQTKKIFFRFLDPNKKKYFQIPRPKQKKNIFRFLDPKKKIFSDSSNPNEAFSWPNHCCCFQLVDCFISWPIVSSAESRSWKWNKMFRNQQKQLFHRPKKKNIFWIPRPKQKNIFWIPRPDRNKTWPSPCCYFELVDCFISISKK